MKKDNFIGLKVSDEMLKQLKVRAKKEERSISEIMRLALRKYLGVGE